MMTADLEAGAGGFHDEYIIGFSASDVLEDVLEERPPLAPRRF